jgi:hypothetical protein
MNLSQQKSGPLLAMFAILPYVRQPENSREPRDLLCDRTVPNWPGCCLAAIADAGGYGHAKAQNYWMGIQLDGILLSSDISYWCS